LVFEFQPGASRSAQQVTLASPDSAAWSATATESWLTVSPSSGQTPNQVSIAVDPAGLAPGTHSAQVVFTVAGGAAAARTNVRVGIRAPAATALTTRKEPPVTAPVAAPTTAPVATPAAAPPTPTPAPKPQAPAITSFSVDPRNIERGQSATLSWSAANASDLSIDQNIGAVQANGTRKVSPASSVTYTISARGPGGNTERSVTLEVMQPAAAPPPINCHAADYTGVHSGSLRWNGSVLPPDGELVFGGSDGNLAGGKLGGQSLPGCEVSVTPRTPGIQIVEPPARADGFRRLKIRNISKSPMSSIEIRWQVQ
jgi:hypothetical protein